MIRPLTFLLGLSLAFSALGETQVLSVTGQVNRLEGQKLLALKQGDNFESSFSVRSDANGQVQLLLDDSSILTLPPNSEVSVSMAAKPQVKLLAGGVNVSPAKGYLSLDAMGFSLKTSGYLRLRQCQSGCQEPVGLYGKTLSGEVIVEYAGGRSVLRNKAFRAAGGARPLILVREPELLAEGGQLDVAAKAKVALAEEIRVGMDAYKNGQFENARNVLSAVREKSPTEKIVTYYLGLTALELKENDAALKYLQQYQRDDPDTARERGVNQLVTLLLTSQLQTEVKQALQQESQLTSDKPEPNTIAVQAFTNRGDPAYAALAKGIAAMVITDLSKIPGLKVLERQKVQKLADEVSLNQSGLVSQDSLVKAGRMMRAEKVVVGSFGVQE
jgi:tetratricopeptide (TPR) repeat protein